MRALINFYMMYMHTMYALVFKLTEFKTASNNHQAFFAVVVCHRIIMVFAFMSNGFAAMKWFTRQLMLKDTKLSVHDAPLVKYGISKKEFLVENTTMGLFHVKPLTYGAAYLNGLILACLVDHGYSAKIYQSGLAAKTCLTLGLVVVTNTLIGYHRGTELLGELPVFSAWEKGSTDLCLSLLSCYAVIYARESGGRLTRFLSTRYWRPIRAAQQTTY
ncbi:unnamed protein product, partial [Medioppia subpectinata]